MDVKNVLKDLQKRLGKDNVSLGINKEIETYSTGVFSVDLASGVGGLARGRLVEIFGKEASGKTFLSLKMIAEAQRKGETCAFIDAEHSFNVSFAKLAGVDTDKLVYVETNTVEDTFSAIKNLTHTGELSLVVLDSISALDTKHEIESFEDKKASFSARARVLGNYYRTIINDLAKFKTSLICVNHLMQKIGQSFGNTDTTPGGKGLDYYASIRLKVSVIKKHIDSEKNAIGNRVKVSFEKNKLAPPYCVAEYDFFYKTGISREQEIFDIANSMELINKEGTKYLLDKKKYYEKEVIEMFRVDKKLLKSFEDKILANKRKTE